MPKFYRQNKKKIDPRYFLNETVERGEDLNENWGKYDQLAKQAGMEPDPLSKIDSDGPQDDLLELLDMVISQIREGNKALHGVRGDRDYMNMSLSDLRDILWDQANSPEQRDIDDRYRREEEIKMGMDSQQDLLPKHQGFGRAGQIKRS